MPPDSTLPSRLVPTLVLVMPESGLLDACLQATSALTPVPSVEVTDVKSAATVVARWRPFAVLVSEEIFDFDPEEFRALARDVGAELITIAPGDSYGVVSSALLPRLTGALAMWERRQAGG